jgi:hypothetical protein
MTDYFSNKCPLFKTGLVPNYALRINSAATKIESYLPTIDDTNFGIEHNANGMHNIIGGAIKILYPSGSDDFSAITDALAAYDMVYLSPGIYWLGTTVVVPIGKILFGAGPSRSKIYYTGAGDGIQVGNHTVNTGGYGQSTLKDFGIYSVPGYGITNIGAGIAFNTPYSYYTVERVQSSQFLWGMVVDQTKLSEFRDLILETRTKTAGAPLWITNGEEWRAGGYQQQSNGLKFFNVQLNQGFYSLIDDGGTGHSFYGLNVNDSAYGVRFAGVNGLTYVNNPSEGTWGSGGTNIIFTTVDALTTLSRKGPCKGIFIQGVTFSQGAATDGPMLQFSTQDTPITSASYHTGGIIMGNHFIGFTGAAESIDVAYLGNSFCGMNTDTGDGRGHYGNPHNDAYGNELRPPQYGSTNSDVATPHTFGDIRGVNFSGPSTNVPGTTGGVIRTAKEATGTPSGTTTYFDIAVTVPSGAKLMGCQLRVDTPLTAGETWGAAYTGGSTTGIANTGTAVAKNTKISTMNAGEITTNTTNVRITRDSSNFTNGVGVIRAIVYYEAPVTMVDN